MFSNLHPSLRNVFYGIVTIFMLLFLATYYTFKVALSASNDVVDKNYYQVGLNYEKNIKEKEVILKEGYHFEILNGTTDWKTGLNSVEVKYLKNTDFVSGKKVYLILERRATDKFNKVLELKEQASGVYSSEVELSAGGEWIMTLSTIEKDSPFEQRFSINVN